MLSVKASESLVVDIDLQDLYLNYVVFTVSFGSDYCLFLRFYCLILSLLSIRGTNFLLLEDKGGTLVVLNLLKIARHERIQDDLICVLARNITEVTRKGSIFGYLFSDVFNVKAMVVLARFKANCIEIVLVLPAQVVEGNLKITRKGKSGDHVIGAEYLLPDLMLALGLQ